MSFQNASLPLSRFIPLWAKNAPIYRTALALIAAARLNNNISASDFGVLDKKRQFKLNYYPIVCDAEGTCADSVCDPGTRLAPKQQMFNLDQCTASKVYELDFADVRLADDGGMTFSDHARAQIASTLPAMRKLLNEQMQAWLVANAGLQLDGSASRRVSMVTSTNGAVNALGRREIERSFENGGYNAPFIVGGTEVDNWITSTNLGTANNIGQNIGQLSSANMFYDGTINNTFGDGGEHIIAFDPTVLKFVAWSNNAGMFATDITSINTGDALDSLFKASKGDGSIRGSLLDPTYGILWDIRIKWHDCGGVDDEGYWTYQYRLVWDIFHMPEQVCNAQGVNGIMHFTSCPPVLAPCPEGDVQPPAPVATVFSWNPDVAYPLYIATAKIGSVDSAPAVNVTNDADMAAMLTENGGGIVFTVSGGNIQYTGYTAITGNLNNNTNFAFAE